MEIISYVQWQIQNNEPNLHHSETLSCHFIVMVSNSFVIGSHQAFLCWPFPPVPDPHAPPPVGSELSLLRIKCSSLLVYGLGLRGKQDLSLLVQKF